MKKSLITLMGLIIGGMVVILTAHLRSQFQSQERDVKIEACIRGWKYSAAHYKAYKDVTTAQIKNDAIDHCKSWFLE